MTTNNAMARSIPTLLPAAALQCERDQLAALIDLLDSLDANAWDRPIGRNDWDVRTTVARIVGRYAARASLTELRRQASPRLIRFYRMAGESLSETVARIQIGDRRNRQGWQLITELREVGPAAIDRRGVVIRPLNAVSRIASGVVRLPAIPLGSLHAARELWLERFAIAETAEQEFTCDDRDLPIVAELIREVAGAGDTALGERAVDLIVTGAGGGAWRFGTEAPAEATIELSPRVLAMLITGRRSPAGVRERSTVSGDVRLAMRLLSAIHPGGLRSEGS